MPQSNSLVKKNLPPASVVLVAAGGISLGLAIIASAQQFPSGIGRLPGPGFFPTVLGVLITLFSAATLFEAPAHLNKAEQQKAAPRWWAPAITVILLAAYLFSWEWIPFLARTPFLVLSLMKLFGARWIPSLLAAIAFTAFLYGVFQLGLRVDLG